MVYNAHCAPWAGPQCALYTHPAHCATWAGPQCALYIHPAHFATWAGPQCALYIHPAHFATWAGLGLNVLYTYTLRTLCNMGWASMCFIHTTGYYLQGGQTCAVPYSVYKGFNSILFDHTCYALLLPAARASTAGMQRAPSARPPLLLTALPLL